MVKASPTGGVKPMAIAGRYVSERERLAGMTDEERAFRKQWLKDQELAPNEPRYVHELYKEQFNIFRRAYRFPLDTFGKALEPFVGAPTALKIRYFTGKIIIGIGLSFIGAYYFKYHMNDWTTKKGWRAMASRVAVVPGDPGYPQLSDKNKPQDYASRGFNDFKLNI